MVSQAVDSFAVISITFGAAFFAGSISFNTLLALMASNYAFKLLAALLDTPLIYLLVSRLRPYLQIPEPTESSQNRDLK